MGRLLSIDYGRKRVGVAVSDPVKIIATGLCTVPTARLMEFLTEYTARETVEQFVVGHPKQADNTESESMAYIRPFLASLKRKFPNIPVTLYDERYTSVLAHKALIEGGAPKKKRQDKALIDTMSATIILTSYMESLRLQNQL